MTNLIECHGECTAAVSLIGILQKERDGHIAARAE